MRQLTGAVGGSVESIYWMFGAHDGIVIADAPDSVSAAALSVAVGSTGSCKHLETHELFTQDQLGQMLARAKDASEAYQPPASSDSQATHRVCGNTQPICRSDLGRAQAAAKRLSSSGTRATFWFR